MLIIQLFINAEGSHLMIKYTLTSLSSKVDREYTTLVIRAGRWLYNMLNGTSDKEKVNWLTYLTDGSVSDFSENRYNKHGA